MASVKRGAGEGRGKGGAGGELLVALLRGINVGGKNKLPMAVLVEVFEKAGCREVRTYIQSGNVVFRSGVEAGLSLRLTGAIEKRTGLKVPVVLRTRDQMRKVLKGNPHTGADEAFAHVAFLADAPGKALVAALDPQRSPGDSFVVRGAEVYLCCRGGAGQTKLTNAYFDSKLGTVSTGRNLRTVAKLVEMMGEL